MYLGFWLYLQVMVVRLVFFVFCSVELPIISEAMLALLTAQIFIILVVFATVGRVSCVFLFC